MTTTPLRPYDLFEIKVATFLIGLTEIGVGLTAFGPPDSLFVQALHAHQMAGWWGMLLVAVGLWAAVVACLPRRQQRHHALIASWAMLWGTFAIFIFWGRITMPTALLWTHGTAALVTFLVDVHAYDRARRRGRVPHGHLAG